MRGSGRGLVAAIAIVWAPLGAGPAEAQRVLKLGNVQAPGMPVQTGLGRFAELVRERTNGAIQIQVFPAAQLGSEQEILEGVHLGTIDMFEGSAGSLGRFLPSLDALSCPFLWRDTASMVEAVRGPIGQELTQQLLRTRRMRILDMGWVFGVRHLTTSRTPVRSPADARGLRIRVQPDAIYIATVRSMGASPTPIPANEVYTALQTGVADGQENPASNIWQRQLHEVQRFLMRTGHITQNQAVIISEEVFQSLTADQQRILTEAAVEAGDFQNQLVERSDAEDLERLRAAGMTIVDPDVTAFREAARNVCRDPGLVRRWGAGFFERLEATQR